MNPRQRRAVARRLTHRSRSAAVVVTLVAAIAAAAWVGTESVLAALGHAPLLASPDGMLTALRDQAWIAGAAATVLGVAGLVLIVLALAPAGQPRRLLADERSVVVIDDTILAGALSRAASDAARVPPGNVRTAVGRRAAHVSVVPTSGFPVPADEISAAVERTLKAAQPSRSVSARVMISPRGAVAG